MRFKRLNKYTKEFRSLGTASSAIRELVEMTSQLDDPVLFVSVGRFSNNVEKVLELAKECKCKVKINAILGREIKHLVTQALQKNPNFELQSVTEHPNGHIPNYLVSDCGFYLQNGLEFEDAIVSFEKEELKRFLTNLYEETLGDVA